MWLPSPPCSLCTNNFFCLRVLRYEEIRHGIFTLKLKSQALASTTTVRLYYPCDLPAEVGNEVKGVITLLHGYTNDGDDWVNMSAALRYAADNGLALIIPDAANSFYMDMAAGPAYYTWLTQEMPALLNKMVKLPQEREKNAICGLSMGVTARCCWV